MGQFVNSFSKGMTSDVSLLYQPEGTYRFMKNCSLISQDGNNFVIKDCMGNVKLFEINIRYVNITAGPTAVTYDTIPTIIGFISFPNKLVIFSTNDDTEGGGYGEIGIINYTTYGEGIQPVSVTGEDNAGYIPIYHHASLHFTKLRQIEGFAYEENDSVQRVYWTDNLNSPRCINVADPIFTTYYASGDLVDGETYMVLQGVVEYPVTFPPPAVGPWYGPSSSASTTISGNIFTASTALGAFYTDMLGPNPNAWVIKYYPIELLDFTPDRSMGTMRFKEYGAGSVICGSKIYFHRLVDTAGSIATSWSYGSSPIHVGTTNDPSAVANGFYFNEVGAGTSSVTEDSGKSVFVTIDNIDQNYDRIQLACAEFDQITDTPRIISIVADVAITGASMDVEHPGNSNLGELTSSDITLFPASIITCKTMTTNKNYILIGNIKERAEFTYDATGITITEIEHKFPVHKTDGASCANVLTYESVMVQADLTANPASVIDYTQWLVTDDSGGQVEYPVASANFYAQGEVFTAIPGSTGVTIPAGSQLRPCVYKQKYTETVGSVPVYDIIQLTEGYWTYKDPAKESHVKGYWSGETYRIGIAPLDKKGNPFYVRWIDDFQFEDLRTSEISETNATYYSLKAKGMRLNGIQFTAAQAAQMSGFMIVRAERDANIITQGLLWQTALLGTVMEPCPFPAIQASLYQTNNDPYYTLICPDRLVDHTMPEYLFAKQIKEAAWLEAGTFVGGEYAKSIDVDMQFESRFITQLTADAVANEQDIITMEDVIEDASITNFGASNLTYTNWCEFGAGLAATYDIDTLCSPNLRQTPSDLKASGGMRTVLEVENGMSYWNGVSRNTSYGALTGTPAGPDKLLVNLTNKKTSFYGGQSEASKANTLYFSTGHFQPFTSAILASVETALNSGIYEFNGVDVFGGDCITSLIDYGHSLKNDTHFGGDAPPVSYVGNSLGLKFPCQSNANYELRRGRTISNNKMHGVPGGVCMYSALPVAILSPQLEGFSYNKGYSTQGIEFAYPSLPLNPFTNDTFKTRIRFAGEKFLGELIDSFRTFLINDRKDLSGAQGEINNLKTKDDKTIVFQNAAISTVPILERQVVSSTTGADTAIGTGGVVDRYDIISSYYGNQHQWSVTETEYGFAWFDMRRKAFLALDFSSGIQELSQIEGLKGFFDEIFLEVIGNTSTTANILNSQTYDKTSDRPLVGVGITGVYDPKFKTTYLTFKFKSRTPVNGGEYAYINKDFTIGYYHPTKMFMGFYDWTPSIAHNHNQTVFSVNNPKCKTQYYGLGMNSTNFVPGDLVAYNNKEYICILTTTIASYPGAANQVPDYVGSTFWHQINQTNQIWVHNQPTSITAPAPDYEYSKFFGQVVDNEVTFIVLPETQNPFSVLNMEQGGNNVNVTDVYTETQYDTASDLNISATSRFYRWIYNAICSSLPLASNGARLTDEYLQVRLRKKNWTTLPYVRTGSVKILEKVKSFFEEKR